MRILISILLTGLLIGCGSKGDTLDTSNQGDKIGDQSAQDFYQDLAEDQDGPISAMIGETKSYVQNGRRVRVLRPQLKIRSNGTFWYGHTVQFLRRGTNEVAREEFERRDGTWFVDDNDIILSDLGVGRGGFDTLNNRTIELRYRTDFRFADIEGELFRFTLFDPF